MPQVFTLELETTDVSITVSSNNYHRIIHKYAILVNFPSPLWYTCSKMHASMLSREGTTAENQ